MSGFKDASLNRLIAIKTLHFIVEKVLVCLDMMRDDCSNNSMKISNREPDICDFLFCNYLNNDAILQSVDLDDFRFSSEVPENYVNNKQIGRADFHVYSINEFRHRDRYFIIECKRIDGHLTLNREYINKGMRRFVGASPKYTSYYKSNCMLGFLVKKMNVPVNVSEINKLLQTDYSDIHTHEYLHAGLVPNIFISSHGLNEDTRINLLHAFSDCSSIVR